MCSVWRGRHSDAVEGAGTRVWVASGNPGKTCGHVGERTGGIRSVQVGVVIYSGCGQIYVHLLL